MSNKKGKRAFRDFLSSQIGQHKLFSIHIATNDVAFLFRPASASVHFLENLTVCRPKFGLRIHPYAGRRRTVRRPLPSDFENNAASAVRISLEKYTECIFISHIQCENRYMTNFYSRYLSTTNKMYIGSTREIENKHLCTARIRILIIRLNIIFNRIMNYDTAQEYN